MAGREKVKRQALCREFFGRRKVLLCTVVIEGELTRRKICAMLDLVVVQ